MDVVCARAKAGRAPQGARSPRGSGNSPVRSRDTPTLAAVVRRRPWPAGPARKTLQGGFCSPFTYSRPARAGQGRRLAYRISRYLPPFRTLLRVARGARGPADHGLLTLSASIALAAPTWWSHAMVYPSVLSPITPARRGAPRSPAARAPRRAVARNICGQKRGGPAICRPPTGPSSIGKGSASALCPIALATSRDQ
jgi:hypothetical protein